MLKKQYTKSNLKTKPAERNWSLPEGIYFIFSKAEGQEVDRASDEADLSTMLLYVSLFSFSVIFEIFEVK